MGQGAKRHQLELDLNEEIYSMLFAKCVRRLPMANRMDDWALEFLYYRFTVNFAKLWVSHLFSQLDEFGSIWGDTVRSAIGEPAYTEPQHVPSVQIVRSHPHYHAQSAQREIRLNPQCAFEALEAVLRRWRSLSNAAARDNSVRDADWSRARLEIDRRHGRQKVYKVFRKPGPPRVDTLRQSSTQAKARISSRFKRSASHLTGVEHTTVLGPAHFPEAWKSRLVGLHSICVTDSISGTMGKPSDRPLAHSTTAYLHGHYSSAPGMSMSFATNGGILDSVLPDFFSNLPIELVEALDEFPSKKILTYSSVGPQRIVGGYFSSTSDRLAIAQWKGQGRKLCIVQHGGGVGLFRGLNWERVESKLSDLYISAGWAKARREDNVQCLPFARGLHDGVADDSTLNAAGLCTVVEDRVVRGHSADQVTSVSVSAVPSTAKDIIDGLSDQWCVTGPEMAIVAYPTQKGLRSIAFNEYDGLGRDNSPFTRIDLQTALVLSDVIIMTGIYGTSFLQVLASGRPFLVLWDAEDYELVAEASDHGARLKDASVAFESADELVAHCIEIYSDIDSWWRSNRIFEVVEAFRNDFAYNPPDAFPRWVKFLKDSSSEKLVPDRGSPDRKGGTTMGRMSES